MKKRAKKKAQKRKMREIILQAITDSGETAYVIAKRSGVDQSLLSRFINGGRDLRLESAEKLCEALGLSLKPDNPDDDAAGQGE